MGPRRFGRITPRSRGASSAGLMTCARAGAARVRLRLVAPGESLEAAQALSREIARFPQDCMRADRRSVWQQEGLAERDALRREWASAAVFEREGASGAARFAAGKGRHGDFEGL